MELDDLKQAWQQQTPEDIDVRNDKNITDMIQNKSYGPIASIKNKLARAFILIPIIIIIFCQLHSENQHVSRNPFFWYCGLICLIPILFNAYWYFELSKIQKVNYAIRENLENEILKFEKILKRYYRISILINIFTFSLLEISFHYHLAGESNSTFLHTPFYVRGLIYIGILILLAAASKFNYQRFFGKHIDYMKDMLRKME